MNTSELEILRQLRAGPVWDGNLVSKAARDDLVRRGVVGRVDGWNFLTADGVSICITIGYLKS